MEWMQSHGQFKKEYSSHQTTLFRRKLKNAKKNNRNTEKARKNQGDRQTQRGTVSEGQTKRAYVRCAYMSLSITLCISPLSLLSLTLLALAYLSILLRMSSLSRCVCSASLFLLVLVVLLSAKGCSSSRYRQIARTWGKCLCTVVHLYRAIPSIHAYLLCCTVLCCLQLACHHRCQVRLMWVTLSKPDSTVWINH